MIDNRDDSWYNTLKMTRNELDKVDHQIIAALREDGRMSFAEIARRLEVSSGMVRERYYRLARSGVLEVAAITNPPALGYRMMTLIGVKVEGSRLQEIARQIATFDEVIYLVLCTGRYDILAEVVCRDNADLLQFLTKRLRAIKGIHDTESFVYLDIVKEVYT
jgi:Lrp/AsnC family transcriptional regulator for asnA, asnC and gidA